VAGTVWGGQWHNKRVGGLGNNATRSRPEGGHSGPEKGARQGRGEEKNLEEGKGAQGLYPPGVGSCNKERLQGGGIQAERLLGNQGGM